MKERWISSLKLDRPGEGRNESFEVVGRRRGELATDPNLALDLMVEHLKLMKPQTMRYLETQVRAIFQERDGQPIPEDKVVELLRDRVNAPAAKATGAAIRFMTSITRYAPDAEAQVEQAYAFLAKHRDLFVGMKRARRQRQRVSAAAHGYPPQAAPDVSRYSSGVSWRRSGFPLAAT